jgi:protein-L-isoaspartate(D-aspartate) O-methyltransferase
MGSSGGADYRADRHAVRAAAARCGLVRAVAARGGLTDPRWRAAFEQVPRHLFVPYYFEGGADGEPGYERLWRDDPDPLRQQRWLTGAYADSALATRVRDGELLSSSSQPSLMARMLQALDVRDEDRVLEIGAGTGYNAALLAHRLGDEQVTTLDVDPEITEAARVHLAEAGYRPAVVTGDGTRGWPERAPYDRIIATCSLASVPPAWLGQCRPGALILAPLATGLVSLQVADAEHAEGRFLDTPAYFVPLRGGGEPAPVRTEGLPRRALLDEDFRFLLHLTAGYVEPVEALALWEHEDRPGRDRYGATVRGERQWMWLDEPESPYAWPLGPAPDRPTE